jgi:RNA recognition motif-containing protein
MTGAATAEVVQSLGLPMFLVGHDVQALQTLAATPSLLSTFVDSNGMYDQVRLTSLVQTLSQGSTASAAPPAPVATTSYPTSGFGSSPVATYGGGAADGIYGPASGTVGYGGGANTTGYRGTQNSDGNLHLSGYGPSTTQAEIIALFSPYVQVNEVVIKQNFCFVNTSDPVGAKNAREALHGALLGGQPVRINMAQRKSRDAIPGADPFIKGPVAGNSYYGEQSTGLASGGSTPGFGQPPAPVPPMGQIPGQAPGTMAVVDVSNVRDDRGNPATKNLFVAGYGQGTTETLLRQVFSPHCEIVGIIQKGSFSFINTADKSQAVQAREILSGTMLNGGVLRINFAKESGRLGTSFDLTYGNKTPQFQAPRSHYGPPRGF